MLMDDSIDMEHSKKVKTETPTSQSEDIERPLKKSTEKEYVEPKDFFPPLISDEEKTALFRELTTILTRRWQLDGETVYGCTEMDLLLATKYDITTLNQELEEYDRFVNILGLKIVEYTHKEQIWYCLKSQYYAPPELSEDQLLVLGSVIALMQKNEKNIVNVAELKTKLVVPGILKEYKIDRILRKLDTLGYVKRGRGEIQASFRLLIEFDDEERKKISKEFNKI